ncbi:LamG-like jellyroll fold domain-containing protein [Kibdelosporangium aridum]|uniref:Concanavalin A-like lectin/glucanases superfamily protein n=1 Tax=Kibdelosporangium aridum TaxID=2030 RepID=A0A1Y5Y8D6_KIBAR|nr:LamG-like jellyroll fold domain-containing protein [Kibdelosporangium aridum]SMD26081.1 Concanavalin A-like lectin/glucanases superfamily protein [Kibdelosporangium aridum]
MSSSRRLFLLNAGLIPAAAALPVPAAASPSGGARPDTDSPRFTLAVIPDTQYLYDRDRGDAAPLEASLRYIVDSAREHNMVFVAHLGDMTENGLASEFSSISRTFRILDRFPYSVLAGNHDIDASKDDQRGPSPYLDNFGPARFRNSPSFRGATRDGYNSYHVFRAAGREWVVLALDWRPSAGSIAWARDVLRKHPRSPVILTTHEFVHADSGDGNAVLSDFGQRLWNDLVKDNDQIFLTLNGHFWPPGRTVLRNSAGNDVHAHITNYQDRYYGGSAMIRLYHFDLARGVIDVQTFSPWLLAQRKLNVLAQQEIERSGPLDYFSVEMDFAKRFSGFAPVPPVASRPAREMVIPGTVAYWRFDSRDLRDLSGNGNDLVASGTPTWSPEHHASQPGHGSVFLDGAYFKTVSGAPLNRATFQRGYTIEAFFKLPTDFNSSHAWGALLSRLGTGRDAGKTGDDPSEPVATLSLSDGHALQWATFPLNQNGISTNWGHELPLGKWWHVAVVNDGRCTTLYVDGARLLRNPSTPAVGISTANDVWLMGAYTYDRKIDKTFYGWIGDVRVVDRPLAERDFMVRS